MEDINKEGDKKECCGGHHGMGGHMGMGHKPCAKIMLGIFILVLTIFVGFKAYDAFLESKYIGGNLQAEHNISVDGTGEVFIKPDIAQISVSVTEKAATAPDAQKASTEKINAVVKFLKDSGIEDKDIKTTSYNIYPDYNYTQTGGRIFTGYVVTQSLDIKVRKMDDAGKILSGATEKGANSIGGINFVVDNEDLAKEQARKQAIDKAKEKANKIASDLGVSLVRLVSFNESGNSPIYMAKDSFTMGAGIASSAPAPVIPTGENKITVSVSLTYEFR